MMRYKWFYPILSLLAIGCGVKEISIDIPEQPPLPVVNGIFKNDSTISLMLSTTQPILNGENTLLTDATVDLYEDGDFLESLVNEDSIFRSTVIPRSGSFYDVSIEIPSLGTVMAKDKVPNQPEITNISFRDSVYTGDEGDKFSQLAITINDPPGEKNYYELILKQKFKGSPTSGEIIGEYPIYDYQHNDLVLLNEGQLELTEFAHPVFSDTLFNGQAYPLKVNYFPAYNIFDREGADLNYDLIVILRSTSKNYYEFKKSLLLHLESQYGDIWNGVPLPVDMFTNVDGGYGIFASYVQITDTIQKQ